MTNAVGASRSAAVGAAARAVEWRRVLLGLLAALVAGAVVALAVRVSAPAGDWSNGLPWERALLLRIDTALPAPVDWALLTLPWIATNYTLAPLLALVVLWLAYGAPRRPDLALHLAVVQFGSWVLNVTLKAAFDRPRPGLWEPRGQFALASYPSGHTIAGVSVLLTIGLLAYAERRARWPLALLGALVLLSLHSRLYLGVHWPTDVIGGLAVGAVWLATSWRAFRPPAPEPGPSARSGAARRA